MKKMQNGFTLVELMIVSGILAVVIVGMLRLYIYTSVLAKMAENKSVAMGEVQTKLEQIRNATYNNIASTYGTSPGNKFDLSGLTGKGAIYVDSSNPDLLEVEIVACWRDKYGRIVGEDTNLNGILEVGEDLNSDGKITSIVQVKGMIARRYD
ncbi:MAG: type II secretion system protein [Candidatus Omnitrophica bacterium]|nr:type II secretion system protein [Candidatus Omnitrophota bacterium]